MTQVAIVYMFFRQSTLEPNRQDSTSLVGSCLDVFRDIPRMGPRAIKAFSRSDITHIVVGVDDGAGMVYCNWSSKHGTQWTIRNPRLIPDHVVYEYGTIEDIDTLDTILPLGERSSWLSVLLWYLTGFPRNTISCSMVVHRIRKSMGLTTKASSPGDICRELTRQYNVDQSYPTGRADP